MSRTVVPSWVRGTLRAPPSKSLTQRALVAALLAPGTSEIRHPSACDDAQATLDAVERLGATVVEEGERLFVTGGRPLAGGVVACGESGFTLRALAPVAALGGHVTLLTAEGSLRARPAGMIREPLEALGARCETDGGYPPVTVEGPLTGGRARVEASITSQVASGLLMALPACAEDSVLEIVGLRSRPYVEMTIDLLERFGVRAQADAELGRIDIAGRQSFRAASYEVEGDWSAAAFSLTAAALGGQVRVTGLSLESRQADRSVLDALELAGAHVHRAPDAVAVRAGALRPFDFDVTACPDLLPALAGLAAHCPGTSTLAGADATQFKESDRARAMARELSRLGVEARAEGGVLRVLGGKVGAGRVEAHGDHRVAMALAVAALGAAGPVLIEGEECIAKSYPGFFDDLETLTEPR